MPKRARKAREKCAGSVNPQRAPTTATGRVAQAGSASSSRQRSRRRERISAAKYPREVRVVDALPLTSVLKTDRKALRAALAAEGTGASPA